MIISSKTVSFLSIITACIIFISFTGCGSDSTTKVEEECPNYYADLPDSATGTKWTIMFYGDGDNNLEDFLLEDIEEMKRGFINDQRLNLIVLADRIDGNSCEGFCEKFTDTRLYKISRNKTTRISGGSEFPLITTAASSHYEANMGDALTLKKFVQFCKNNYPADNYALILWNHGSGPMKKKSLSYTSSYISSDTTFSSKAICEDWTSNYDILYTAEITDNLGSSESADLLVFDACLMGSVEVAYQYRPGNGRFEADYMAASPANMWGDGLEYDKILERLKSGGGDNGETNNVTISGNELFYDPATDLTALTLGEVIVEEQYDSVKAVDNSSAGKQTFSLYDLSKAEAVKSALDTLTLQTLTYNITPLKYDLENIRGSGSIPNSLHYFNASDQQEWISWPLFDLYDLFRRAVEESAFNNLQDECNAVLAAASEMTIYSFAGSFYDSYAYAGLFKNGFNGLSVFFPDGDRLYNHPTYGPTEHWAFQWWYNAVYTHYGKLSWCINSADGNPCSTTDSVENWFELLDSWFDTSNGADGGLNDYQY
ncbi:MAG: clostripain [Spirochaetes bacterium]|nr:clostripain [Spirochaetota bacterium]